MCINVQLIHIVAASVSTPQLCGSISKEGPGRLLVFRWYKGGVFLHGVGVFFPGPPVSVRLTGNFKLAEDLR